MWCWSTACPPGALSYPLMPSSHHLLSFCTNANLEPSLPKSATLTWQPSKFMNGLLPVLTPSNHRPICTASLLHPCMLVSWLPCTIPFARFWSPPQSSMSYPRTATKCTSVQVWSTTVQDDTNMDAVSTLLTLFRHHNNHTAGSCQTLCLCATACTNQICTTSAAHTCCTHNTCDSTATDHSCFHHTSCPKGHPCAYTHGTQHSPCAAQKIRSCSCSTQVPDTGDVTILQPMKGDPWPGTSLDFIT